MPTDRAAQAWRARACNAVVQALEDLSCAGIAGVSVVEAAHPDDAASAMASAALAAGFAVASASLAEHGFHGLDGMVHAFAQALVVPGGPSRGGLAAALDAFIEANGRRAEERFEAAADAAGLGGELRALASSYVGAASGRSAGRRLSAWLRGDDPSRASDAAPLRVLAPRTAKSALSALTQLVVALGHRGTLLCARDAETLDALPPGRADAACTVLRELVDNGDGRRGLTATKLVVVGPPGLFAPGSAIDRHAALASRLAGAEVGAPSPHAPRLSFDPVAGVVLGAAPEVAAPSPRKARALRSLVRVTQGLPPLEAAADLTVGMEEVDARVDKLFEHAANDGSVFAVLAGAYGAGKTHHLLHIEARALADQRPVFWLSVERLDEDLGNPQRHLRRLLEGATLPGAAGAGPLDRLEPWLRSEASRRRLAAALRAIAEEDGEASVAARRALRGADDDGALDEAAVLETLRALDLVDRPAGQSYRKDAYGRLQLWIELLARLEGCEGPVVLLDEAENLYRPGVSRPERRTALRSLSFYCGGSIARACVVLAVTPESLEELRAEADELLDAIEEQKTLLAAEDVAMLRSRLTRSKPIRVVKLGRAAFATLADQARALDERVHGRLADPTWEAWVTAAIADASTPRELLRRVALHLEQLRWGAGAPR